MNNHEFIRVLTVSDFVNLAKCASDRAAEHVLEPQRFASEFTTMGLWARCAGAPWAACGPTNNIATIL